MNEARLKHAEVMGSVSDVLAVSRCMFTYISVFAGANKRRARRAGFSSEQVNVRQEGEPRRRR